MFTIENIRAKFDLSDRQWLMLLVGLVFVMRLGVLPIFYPSDLHLALNFDRWGTIASNLADGYGYTFPHYTDVENGPPVPNVQRVPVPVLWFAGIFWLFGRNLWTIMLGNWLLDALSVVLLFRLARYLFPQRQSVAVLAGVMWAGYVPHILNGYQAAIEPLLAVLLLLFLDTLIKLLDKPSLGQAVLAGLWLALAGLSNPIAMLLGPPAVGLMLLAYRRLQPVFIYGGLLTLVFFSLLAPWIGRNYVVFDEFIPTSSLLGYNLFINTYYIEEPDYPDYIQIAKFAQVDRLAQELVRTEGQDWATYDQLERDAFFRQFAFQKIEDNPGRYLTLTLHRIPRMWFNLGYHEPPSILSWLTAALNGLILVLAAIGLATAPRLRQVSGWMVWLTPLIFTAIYMLIHTYVRHAFPLMPLIMLMAALGIHQMARKYILPRLNLHLEEGQIGKT